MQEMGEYFWPELESFEADFLKHLKELKATRTVVDCIN